MSASSGAVHLWLWLSWHDRGNGIFPSLDELARRMNCSEKTIQRYREELRQAGYLSWRRQWIRTKQGPQQICVYELNPEPKVSGHQSPSTITSEWTSESSQAEKRLDISGATDWTNEPKVSGRECPSKSSSSNQTPLNQSSERLPQATPRMLATAESLATTTDEDEPGETRQGFARLLRQRHGLDCDAERICDLVLLAITGIPGATWADFHRLDRLRTATPGLIKNPAAYYRDLARQVVPPPRPPEPARCDHCGLESGKGVEPGVFPFRPCSACSDTPAGRAWLIAKGFVKQEQLSTEGVQSAA